VPGLLSGLLLIVFGPLIFGLGQSTYVSFTGITPSTYLVRWLLTTAALFVSSALLYAVSLARARRKHRPASDPAVRPR
jgi:uncharacterized BrkB/YihY/UPF0761 family membrane protein